MKQHSLDFWVKMLKKFNPSIKTPLLRPRILA
jgi:hypothetical protein